jgi:SAM-dependent methyltransferase
MVTHIDEAAIARLTAHYAQVLQADWSVLDLMSSWVSHLPADLALRDVIGHGMNASELAANPRLTRRFVQDLNRDTTLPLESESIDAALCCVSVQYLQQPIAVFGEVRRVLRTGGPFVVTYSNRCFPTKAVAIWRALDYRKHADLVGVYLRSAGFEDTRVDVLANGMGGDLLVALTARA